MRIDREKELNRIRNDKKALSSYVEEKEAGIIQLESIIKKVLEDKARLKMNVSKELQSKVKQYDSEAASQTDEENQKRLQEVQGMEQSIRQYQQQAQSDLQKKEFDLLKPISEKAQAAIVKVATAQGFDYVMDSTQGQGERES